VENIFKEECLMIINHNLMAMNAHRQLSINNTAGSKSLEKLSSGYRINRAGDDAAGLAISEKMRGQIRGLNQASRNAQDGISLIQTAEGALNETHSILQRMRELAVQAATDTNTDADRAKIQAEVDQLAAEITRISNTTEFNTRNLLAGGLNTTFHIGANEGQNVKLNIMAMDAFSLGVAADAINGTLASGAVDIEAVTVTGTGGAAIVSGNTITVSAAYVSGSDATNAVMTGSGAVQAITSSNAGDLVLSIDGGESIIITLASGDDVDDVVDKINEKLGSGASADLDSSGALIITSASTGATSSVEVLAGSTDKTLAALGLQVTKVTGADATEDSYTITLSSSISGVADLEITGVKADTTTITGTGAYAGLVLTTDGEIDKNLAGTITMSVAKSSAAVTDSGGAIITAAKAAAGINVSTQAAADKAITIINDALEKVSAERSKLGAMQNRLEHTIANLDTSAENLQASESRIRDVDMAKEMMEFTKNSILQQAATAMLAQANQQPQTVLQLLR